MKFVVPNNDIVHVYVCQKHKSLVLQILLCEFEGRGAGIQNIQNLCIHYCIHSLL